MGFFAHAYFSAPAEADGCPFFDGSLRSLGEFRDNGWDLRIGFLAVGGAGEVGGKGLLFFGSVEGEPTRVGVVALE